MKLQLIFIIISVSSCFVEGRRINVKATGEDAPEAHVPSLSLFIPPPRLVSIVTDAFHTASPGGGSVRPNLIVDPLLAMLDSDESRLLAMLLPHLFDNNTTPTTTTSTPTSTTTATTPKPLTTVLKSTTEKSVENIKNTSDDRSSDAVLNWLIHGSSNPDPPRSQFPTPGPMLSITEDMLISMLQQAVANFSQPTSTMAPSTSTQELLGPVGIGDDLLAMLLKTLQTQTDKSMVSESSIDVVSTEKMTTTTTATSMIIDDFPTKSSNFWPENVKPGGGISDDALASIIKDVNDINNNISTLAGVPTIAMDEEPVTISSDHVAQLMHDVELAVNATNEAKPTKMDDEKSTGSGRNKPKNNGGGVKTNTKSKGKPSGGRETGNKKGKKKPGRRPGSTRTTARRPNVWERLVSAASNAIFGEKKQQPGFFQIEDILDLLANF